MVNNNLVLIGASSEIAIEFNKICYLNGINTLLVTRNSSLETKSNSEQLVVKDYLEDYERIKHKISTYKSCIVIFFNGVLYENRPISFPSAEEIRKTIDVNYTIPYGVCSQLSLDLDNIEKYIFISTIAAVKPRFKNYIYGNNKKKLEESIYNLNLPSKLIIRFGKVFTNMSLGHKTPPFTLKPEVAAEKIFSNLDKTDIIYPNFGLKVIAFFLKVTPSSLINKIGL